MRAFVVAILAVLIVSTPAEGRQHDFVLSSETIAKSDVPTIERQLHEAIARGETISTALWSVQGCATELRRSSALAAASEWIDLLDRITARAWPDLLIALYAAIDRAQIQLRLGWPDLADRSREEIDRRLARIPVDHPSRDYAVAARGLFELDFALAIESFGDVVATGEELAGKLSAPVRERFANEIDSRVALAKYGLARRDAALTPAAITALEERIGMSALDAQTQARHALSIADLECRRAQPVAMQRALERGGQFLAAAGPGVPTELIALHAALRVRLTLDFKGDVADRARWERILGDSLERTLRAVESPRSNGIRTFADAGGPPGFLHFGSLQDALTEWIRVTRSSVSTEAAFQCVLDAQAVGWLSRSLRVSLAEVRRDVLIDEQHALLVFVPGPYATQAFTLTKQAIHGYRLPSIIELKRRRDEIERFLAVPLSDSQRVEYREVAERVARAFLPPALLREIEGCSSWSISAMGSLATMPFEALVVNGMPLALERDIDRIPSLPLAVATSRRARERILSRPTQRAVVRVVAPEVATELRARLPELVDLEFARQSVSAIEALYGSGIVDTRFGRFASFPQQLDLEPAIVEFFAHGIVLDSALRPSALALAPTGTHPSGLLDCDGFASWSSAPRLVILAACGAALGPYRAGNEGSLSLVGSLLDLGVDSVIASNRRIEARATLELVLGLHRGARAGESPARALRCARSALVEARGGASPSEFALLTVIGCGQLPIFAVSESDTGDFACEPAPAAARWPLALFVFAGVAILLVASWRRWRRE